MIKILRKEIINYLSRSENTSKCDSLVKFEVSEKSDFSFPINLQIWSNYLKIYGNLEDYHNNILVYAANNSSTDENQAIIEALLLAGIKIDKEVCHISLIRDKSLQRALDLVNRDDFCRWINPEAQSISIDIEYCENSSITNYRLQTMQKITRNLLRYSQYTYANDSSTADHRFVITTRSNFKANESVKNSNVKIILCGVVCNNDKKMSVTTAENYLKMRQDDMHLIALHKYGVRVKDNVEFMELTEKLGRAASILDMVEVKHTNTLKLTSNPKQAFILYNSARLENLLNTFNEKVQQNYYPELPPFSQINLGLLTEDKEWELTKHLLLLPEILEKSIADITSGQIALHALYKYLIAFVNTFSVYYSRKKILIENRPHLIPIIHAKIYLLKAIQKVFNIVLEIFDIEPVLFM